MMRVNNARKPGFHGAQSKGQEDCQSTRGELGASHRLTFWWLMMADVAGVTEICVVVGNDT